MPKTSELPDCPTSFRDWAVDKIAEEIRTRYDIGQKKYNDYIVDRATLRDVQEELMDALVYTKVIELRILLAEQKKTTP